jgi:hypothetical protein
MDEVDAPGDVLLTAQGLLMYFRPREVRALLGACAERFPGGTMLFDAVPRRMSARTLSRPGTRGGYRPPPMPWGMDAAEIPKVRTAHPGIVEVSQVRVPRGRGFSYGYAWPVLNSVPVVRARRLLPSSPGGRGGLRRQAWPVLNRIPVLRARRFMPPPPMTIVRARFGPHR